LRIRDVDAIMLRLSDEIYERDALAIKGGAEHPMEVLLVMVETDNGLVGYGESISYGGLYAVHAAVKRVLSLEVWLISGIGYMELAFGLVGGVS
jgi:D-arabinonate dehydratase